MESLLDLADALARTGAEPSCPDFTIPLDSSMAFSCAAAQQSEMIVLREAVPHRKGQGWFAVQDIPAGTLLFVAKPLGMVMDWQDDHAEEEEDVYAFVHQEKSPPPLLAAAPHNKNSGGGLYRKVWRRSSDESSIVVHYHDDVDYYQPVFSVPVDAVTMAHQLRTSTSGGNEPTTTLPKS